MTAESKGWLNKNSAAVAVVISALSIIVTMGYLAGRMEDHNTTTDVKLDKLDLKTDKTNEEVTVLKQDEVGHWAQYRHDRETDSLRRVLRQPMSSGFVTEHYDKPGGTITTRKVKN